MTTIPDDIMRAAEAVHREILGRGTRETVEAISRAILAERERCAKVAKSAAHHSHWAVNNICGYEDIERHNKFGAALAGHIAAKIKGANND